MLPGDSSLAILGIPPELLLPGAGVVIAIPSAIVAAYKLRSIARSRAPHRRVTVNSPEERGDSVYWSGECEDLEPNCLCVYRIQYSASANLFEGGVATTLNDNKWEYEITPHKRTSKVRERYGIIEVTPVGREILRNRIFNADLSIVPVEQPAGTIWHDSKELICP